MSGITGIAELCALDLSLSESRPCALRYHATLLLRQCCVEVEHEGVGIGAEFSHDEGDTLGHQPGDEGDIT